MRTLFSQLLASILALAVRPYQRFVGWIGVACSAASFAAALVLCVNVVLRGLVVDESSAAGLWRIDALSALLALCIAFVALLASALAPSLRELDPEDDEDGVQTRRLRAYMGAFSFTMLMAVTVQNVALMWVAIEATTPERRQSSPLRSKQ